MDSKSLYKYIKGLREEKDAKDANAEGKGKKMLVTFADYDPFKDESKDKKKTSDDKKSVEASGNTGPSGETTKIDFEPEQLPTNGY